MAGEVQRTREPLGWFEKACIAIMLMAFIIRIPYMLQPWAIVWDTAWYLMLARSFAEDGTFWIRYTDPPQYSGYWPPLFPLYTIPFVAIFGATYKAIAIAAVTASGLLTATVFFATRDLFDRTRAFGAAALISVTPTLLVTDRIAMSESLLLLVFTLTVWAFLKSIDDSRWLPVSGAFAFITYLGKASLGLPFVGLALVAVGAWRVKARGFSRIIRSPMDIGLALSAVVVLVVLALTRTGRVGGIGVGIIEPVRVAIAHPLWIPIFLFKLVFLATFLWVVTLPFSIHLPEALREKKDERTGALWIATLLPLVAAAVFTASFHITESRGPTEIAEFLAPGGFSAAVAGLVDFGNIRYLTPALISFLWLMMPHVKLPTVPSVGVGNQHIRRRHERIYFAAVGLFTLLVLLDPNKGSESKARLQLFFALALAPLFFAFLATRVRYRVSRRIDSGGVAHEKYVEEPALEIPWKGVGVIVAVGMLGAWFGSAWYLAIALAFLVAFSAADKRHATVAMIVILALGTLPAHSFDPRFDDIAADLPTFLPAGSTIGVDEPAAFIAAVIPSQYTVRVEYIHALSPDADALLFSGPIRTIPGFEHVKSWNFTFEAYPALGARLWIEEHVMGRIIDTDDVVSRTLYMRTTTE